MRRSAAPNSLVFWIPAFRMKWSLLLFAFLLLQPRTFAQNIPSTPSQQSADDDESEAPWTSITIELNDRQPAYVDIATSDASTTTDISRKYDFVQVVAELLACKPSHLLRATASSDPTALLSVECDVATSRSLLSRRGTINLDAVKKIQSAEPGRELSVTVYVPAANILDCEGLKSSAINPYKLRSYCFYFVSTTPASTIHFAYGYTQSQALLIAGVLASLLAIPVVLTFVFRRRASRVSEEAKPSISFAYRRFVIKTALVGSLVWWAALDILHVDAFAGFVIPFPNLDDLFASVMLLWAFLWAPAILVYFLCLVLSSPMLALRGITRTPQEALSQSFWTVGRFVFPVAFAAMGAGEMFSSPRIGALFLGASVVVGKIVNRNIVRTFGIEMHALTSGELRDRAFALAKTAGAKLNQLYVFPAARLRMANAFAHAAQNVYLTDYLLQNLSKAEVDAVVGHEITHLQKKHVSQGIAVAIVAIVVIGFSSGLLEHSVSRSVPVGPILYASLLLLVLIRSRRNEFAADAGSVKITGNAEAMITALARVMRLNTMPLHWTKLDEKLLTHPSTLRRVKRLAQDAGISEAHLSELLTESVAPPRDLYSIPATALPSGKIFSTQYKKRIASRLVWAAIAVTSLFPAISVSIAHRGHLEGTNLWLAYSTGFLLTIFANLVVFEFLSLRGNQKLEESLRKKLGSADDLSGGTRGLFVGLAPDSAPRIYEWNWSWDLGFLELDANQLRYRGEEANFGLSRSEITSIAIGPGPVGWFQPSSIYISWRDSAGHSGTFNLRAMSANSLRKMAAKTRSLAEDLQNWQRGSAISNRSLFSPSSHEAILPSPIFGQVTSLSPRVAVRGQNIYVEFLLNTLFAAGVILVFGISLPPLSDLSRPDGPIDLRTDYGGIYVLFVVWAVRIFVLLPYWRTREESDAPTPSLGAPVPNAGSNTQTL